MAEYYGYAERDASSYVDWGKLGQNLTDTVQAAYKIREDKKAALDKAMQDNYAELANSPTGENQDINGAVTGFADNSKQYLLQVNKLLKAGVLKPKDYTLIMQNIQEDTKSLFDNAKNWQTAYAKILERNKNSTGSKAELDVASDVSAFGKFKNLSLMINPTTGRVSGAQMTKGPNGELIKGDTKSMQQLNVLMNQPIDKYQLTEKLAAVTDKLGDYQISKFREARRGKNGEIIEIQDKQLKASFDAAKNGFINEVMANPFNVMSILTDHQGVVPGTTDAYRVSINPDPADRGKPNVIMYIDPDGDGSFTPDLTPAQKKAAEQYATDQFLGLIDHKEEKAAIAAIADYHKTEGEGTAETKKYNGEMFGQNVANAIYGDTEDLMNQGLRGMAGLGNIKYATKQGNTLYIYTDKNEPISYTITDDNKDDVFNQIIMGAAEQAGAMNYLDPSAAKKKALETVKNKNYNKRLYNEKNPDGSINTKRGGFDTASTDRRPKATETNTGAGAGDAVFK
jgi:hypothetical protein